MAERRVVRIEAFLGVSGLSVLTGEGVPDSSFGRNGESYVDLDTGIYYVKDTSLSNPWEAKLQLTPLNAGTPSVGSIYPEPTYTDNGDGTVTIGEGVYSLRDNPNSTGNTTKYTVASDTFTPPMGVSFIAVKYNGGTPIYFLTTNVLDINESSVAPTNTITNDGIFLHPEPWDSLGSGLSNKLHKWFVKNNRFTNESGNVLTEDGTRHLLISLGHVWLGGATEFDVPAFDSNDADTDPTASGAPLDPTLFYFYQKNGPLATDWDYSFVQTYENTKYNPQSGGLTELTSQKYTVLWVYRDLDPSPHAAYVLHDEQYATIAAASEAQPRTDLPSDFSFSGQLVGSLIIRKGEDSGIITSAFKTTFAGSPITDHESLANLLGGSAAGHFHNNSDTQDGLNNSNGISATNAAATLVDLFMRGTVNVIGMTAIDPRALFLKNNEIYRVTDTGSAVDIATLTLNTGSLVVGDAFMVYVDQEYGSEKQVKMLIYPTGETAYLKAGDGIILQWMGGTSFRKLSYAPNATVINGAYRVKGSYEVINPIGPLLTGETLDTDAAFNSQTSEFPVAGTIALVYSNFVNGRDQWVTSRILVGTSIPTITDSGDGSAAILAVNLVIISLNILQVNSIDGASTISQFKANPLT